MIEQINNLLTLSGTPRYNIKAAVQQTIVAANDRERHLSRMAVGI